MNASKWSWASCLQDRTHPRARESPYLLSVFVHHFVMPSSNSSYHRRPLEDESAHQRPEQVPTGHRTRLCRKKTREHAKLSAAGNIVKAAHLLSTLRPLAARRQPICRLQHQHLSAPPPYSSDFAAQHQKTVETLEAAARYLEVCGIGGVSRMWAGGWIPAGQGPFAIGYERDSHNLGYAHIFRCVYRRLRSNE